MARTGSDRSARGGGGGEKKSDRSKPQATTASDRQWARMRRVLLICGVLGCALPFLVPLLLRLLHAINPPAFTELSSDSGVDALRHVFSSGETHLLFCTNRTGLSVPNLVKRTGEAARMMAERREWELDDAGGDPHQLTEDEANTARTSGVLTAQPRSLTVATIDCDATDILPSGKSVRERFGLSAPPPLSNPDRTPPALLVARGERPEWVPATLYARESAQLPALLASHAWNRATARSVQLTSEKLLHQRCLSRRACAVLLHERKAGLARPAASRVFRSLALSFPALALGTLDVRAHTLAPLQRQLPPLADSSQKAWPRLILFRRVPTPGAKEGSKDTTLLVKVYRGGNEPASVVEWTRALLENDSATAATGESSESSTLYGMAVLKRPPALNYGVENWKRAPEAGKRRANNKDKAKGTAKTSTSEQRKQTTAPAGKTATTASAESSEAAARADRDAEARRREQMDEEAASLFEADEGEEEETQHRAEDEEEVVSLDESADEL